MEVLQRPVEPSGGPPKAADPPSTVHHTFQGKGGAPGTFDKPMTYSTTNQKEAPTTNEVKTPDVTSTNQQKSGQASYPNYQSSDSSSNPTAQASSEMEGEQGSSSSESSYEESSFAEEQDSKNQPGPSNARIVKSYLSDSQVYKVYDFGESVFDVLDRYVPKELVGQGAYGVVSSAYDMKAQKNVAIKKVEIIFEHKTYMKRTLREIMFLRSFDHENIIGLKTIMRPSSREFNEVYLVTDLMETDLSCIIRSPQELTDEHCQFFIYQVLRGLKYIHSAAVIHRDLKPRNLLVNSDCDLKICDFGLARVDFPELSHRCANMTDYVATRWYRAPEVILTWKRYTTSIDMWAVGCILAELLGRKPLFPGKDAFHQVSLIISILGSPDPSEMERIPRRESRNFVASLPRREKIPFAEIFPFANPLACDLLENLLTFDPDKRYSVDDALRHPYLEQLHCEEDEPISEGLDLTEFDFERRQTTKEEFFELIQDEISRFHPHDPLFKKPKAKSKTMDRISKIFKAFPRWSRKSSRRRHSC